jgi:hypothetical protein
MAQNAGVAFKVRFFQSDFASTYCVLDATTLIIQTLTKKSLNDICPKPKKLYKLYKLYNAKYVDLKK